MCSWQISTLKIVEVSCSPVICILHAKMHVICNLVMHISKMWEIKKKKLLPIRKYIWGTESLLVTASIPLLYGNSSAAKISKKFQWFFKKVEKIWKLFPTKYHMTLNQSNNERKSEKRKTCGNAFPEISFFRFYLPQPYTKYEGMTINVVHFSSNNYH